MAVLIAVAIAPAGSAATYYVNNKAPLASDNNPGTEDRPWRTVGKAARTVKPGDRVIVRPGLYPERVNFYGKNLASATTRTVFESQPRHGATVYGFDTLHAPHLVIRNFDMTIPQSLLSTDWTAKYAVFVRSQGTQVVGNMIRNVPGVGISGYWVEPWVSNVGIFLNTIRRCNEGIVIYGHNWRVGANHVNQLVKYDMDCDYMRFFGTKLIIRRNFLRGARLSEIGNSHVDGFQTFPNNGWYADNVVIDGNYVESFHQGAMIGVPQHAQMTGYLRNIRFTNNVFIGGEIGGSWGVQFMDAQNVTVQYNLFKDLASTGSGVGVREYSSAIVQNNTFFNAGQNYYADSTSTLTGGYNVLNRQNTYPLYTNRDDRLADPLMWNAANLLGADNWPWTADDGYKLRDVSPGRDTGGGYTIGSDIYFTSRPQGIRPDVGPHEYMASSARDEGEMDALLKNVTELSGQEAIEIRLSNPDPIDVHSLWADVPVQLEDSVRVEWDFDSRRPNDVWVRIVPVTSWERLATGLGLGNAPFEVGIGNDDLESGRLLYAVSNAGSTRR